MSLRLHHEEGAQCPLCDWKLTTAHPRLAQWFWALKKRYKNAHVSWAYRNEDKQKLFFNEGKSRVLYPNSKHNKVDAKGNPCSLALDLFQIDEDGLARFPNPWYAKIHAENEANREPIVWGGSWEKFPDLNHFELKA